MSAVDLSKAWKLLKKATVPEGKSGDVEIRKLTIERGDLMLGIYNMKNPQRAVAPGTYTQLFRRGHLWMSDTDAERRDHLAAVANGRGRVLVTGLGIGLVAEALLRKKDVELIRIVELDPDVIKLVGPHLKQLGGARIEIVQADAMELAPTKGERWGAIWHDIWADICEDNLVEMRRLARRWKPYADWQGFWAKDLCERRRGTAW